MSGSKDGFMNNEKLYNMIKELSDKVNKLFIEVRKNNHIKDEVAENNRQIEKLTEHVNKVTKRINKIENEQQGRQNYREKIAWFVAVLSSVVSILAMTGVV